MVSSALIGTVVMGAILLGFGFVIVNSRSKDAGVRAGNDAARGSQASLEDRLTGVANSTTTWLIGFVLLSGLALGGTLLAVGAGPEGLTAMGLPIFAGVIGLGTLAFILLGSYYAVKARGYGNAMAVGAASFSFGIIAIVAVTALLLFESL